MGLKPQLYYLFNISFTVLLNSSRHSRVFHYYSIFNETLSKDLFKTRQCLLKILCIVTPLYKE